MAQQQESNPIDQLFQQKFGALPDSPAANGWDTPSDRVWQGIEGNLQTKATSSVRWKGLVGAAVLVIGAAATYWALRTTPDLPPAPASAPVMEQPVSPQPAAQEAAPVAAPEAAPKPKPATTTPKTTNTAAAKPANTVPAQQQTPNTPASTKAKTPNSLEKRLQEESEKAAKNGN